MFKKVIYKAESFATLLYLCTKTFLSCKKDNASGKILIVEGGGMGDTLLDAFAIVSIAQHFVEQRKEVYLFCSVSTWELLKMIPGTESLRFVCGPESKRIKINSFRSMLSAVKKIQFECTAAFTCRNLQWQFFATSVDSGKRYMINIPVTGNRIKRLLYKILRKYALLVPDDPNVSRQKLAAIMAEHMGVKCSPEILYIPKQIEYKCTSDKYVVISVDSFIEQRRWPANRFVELISWILDRYKYNVVLTGNNVPPDALELYHKSFCKNEHVTNLIGKTKLGELVEVIRGSEFLVGVDSGAVHLAASVGTQAFCLTGHWDGNRFFPYLDLEHNDKVSMPICIYRSDVDRDSLSCSLCIDRGGFGRGNDNCLHACKMGKQNTCLGSISVNDVASAIERAI